MSKKKTNYLRSFWTIIGIVYATLYVISVFKKSPIDIQNQALLFVAISGIFAYGEEILGKINDKNNENGKEY